MNPGTSGSLCKETNRVLAARAALPQGDTGSGCVWAVVQKHFKDIRGHMGGAPTAPAIIVY